MSDAKTFASYLESRDLDVIRAAALTGVAERTIRNLINGWYKRAPHNGTIVQLARGLGITEAYTRRLIDAGRGA